VIFTDSTVKALLAGITHDRSTESHVAASSSVLKVVEFLGQWCDVILYFSEAKKGFLATRCYCEASVLSLYKTVPSFVRYA